MNGRRWTVAVLGGASAGIAGLVGAVSLTRIAESHLGFPDGLYWTLTGAVDVAGIAGGVMWTAFRGRVRAIGRPMNLVCTGVSGVGVGLDHAAHARPEGPWPLVAFAVGVFIPLLFTWLIHALAVIGDQGRRDEKAPGVLARVRGLLRPRPTPVVVEQPAQLVSTDKTAPAPEPEPPATPAGPLTVAPDPDPPVEGIRALARRWLREHYRPGMRPAELTEAMHTQGVVISKQEASRNVQWAAVQPWARAHDPEEVSA